VGSLITLSCPSILGLSTMKKTLKMFKKKKGMNLLIFLSPQTVSLTKLEKLPMNLDL
jgi:hypothetical protein